MSFLLMPLVVAIASGTIPVEGYSLEGETVNLVWEDLGTVVAIALESGGDRFTEYVEYPGLFNSAKIYVMWDDSTGEISVYSQYPFTANYYLAVYVIDDSVLTLVEGSDHDSYRDALQSIMEYAHSLQTRQALLRAWEVMYPHANPYYREMSVVLLSAAVGTAEEMLDSGAEADSILQLFDEVDAVCMNLSTVDMAHLVVEDSASFPSGMELTLEEYADILSRYADILDALDEEEKAESVRLASLRM